MKILSTFLLFAFLFTQNLFAFESKDSMEQVFEQTWIDGMNVPNQDTTKGAYYAANILYHWHR